MMPALLLSFFNFVFDFFKMFKWGKILDFAMAKLKFSAMLSVNLIIMGFMAGYFAALIYALNFIYTKLIYIIDYINNATNSGEAISLLMSVLSAYGIWNALCDVFSVFLPFIIAMLGIYGSKLGIVIFKNSREVLLSLFISRL